MTLGIDYSFARPAPSAIHAAGYRFAVRYLFPGSKGIDRAEADALAAAGLWIAGVYESTSTWMLGGHPAGEIAARSALGYARAAGMPEGRPIYFAADFDADAAQAAEVLNCLRGAATVLGKDAVGVYGGLAVIRAAADAGAAAYFWQTLAWSGGVWDPRAQLRQTVVNTLFKGSGIDINEAVADDYGQWMPGKVPGHVVPKPLPATIPEDAMLLNKGKGAVTPVAIPDTAHSLRFVAAGTAELEVTFHGAAAQALSLSWAAGSHSLAPPKDVWSALVTRMDAGVNDVAVVAQ